MVEIYTPSEVALDWADPPGRMLQRELDAQGLTQAQLATRTGLSTKHINLVVKGTALLSPDVAISLEQVLGVPAEFWLKWEAAYQAAAARTERRNSWADFAEWAARFPRNMLISRHVIEANDRTKDVVAKLLTFFAVASPDAFEKTWMEAQVSYKRSQAFTIDPYVTALWLRLAEREAERVLQGANAYDASRLKKAAGEIRALTVEDMAEGFRRAQQLLRKAGVALVFVPELDGTRISGVSRWVGGRPMIAVTNRYKYFDSFWFSVLHEIGHVLLHPKRATYIDIDGAAHDNDDALETAADQFAQDSLIPRAMRDRVKEATTAEAVHRVAHDIGVGSGIVASQHAFLTKNWRGMARLRPKGDLAELID